jgi:hypothetical protein
MRRVLIFLGIAAQILCAETREKWKMQFFHDKLDSTLVFEDIACPAAGLCIAVGAITSDNGKFRPTAVVTSDGGEHWNYVDLKQAPYSVFFLDASLGWIAGEKGILRTTNGGSKWTEMAKLEGIEQVWFVNPTHGWAVGSGAKFFETQDAGKSWTKATISGLSWPDEQVALEWVAFTDAQHGIVAGSAYPMGQLRTRRPDWMDPQKAKLHREPPSISFPATTSDGGRTWTAGKPFSNRGTLSRLQPTPAGGNLAILQYQDGSDWPAQILDVDPAAKSKVFFEMKDKVIKDILPLPGGQAIVAAIQPPGTSYSLPVPGKLSLYWLDSPTLFHPMDVDYRAVGANAVLAAFDASHVWVATDTGMILKLETK